MSEPGGELAGDPPEEPQEEDPEWEEDIELVLCRDGIPCTSLRFTTFGNKKNKFLIFCLKFVEARKPKYL